MRDVAVVIGIGGMGEAICRRIGSGRQLLLADMNAALLENLADNLSSCGYAVETAQIDVSKSDDVTALARRAAGMGTVSALAHTAGVSPVQASSERILSVDLLGTAIILDAFGEVMAPGGAGVVIASMAGQFVERNYSDKDEFALGSTPTAELLELPLVREHRDADPRAAYSLAKRANQLRVRSASLSWARRGARINSISPGTIATPMGHQELSGETGSFIASLIEANPMQRMGTPDDIAAASAFLLGPDACYITGTDLLVDGGTVAALRCGMIARPF